MDNYKLNLGASIEFVGDYERKFKRASELGFYSADIDLTTVCFNVEQENLANENIENVINSLKKTNLVLNGVHISYGRGWDPSAIDPQELKENILRIQQMIKRVSVFEPRCFVIHGCCVEPSPDEELSVRKRKIEILKNTMATLSEKTKTTLCVENLPRTCLLNCSEEINEFMEWIENRVDNVKICFDANHFTDEKTEDVIKNVGKYIFTTHICDCDYIHEKHWMPLKGKIDWNKVIEAFEMVDYHGAFTYELMETSYESLEQIKENYQTLFNNYYNYKKLQETKK